MTEEQRQFAYDLKWDVLLQAEEAGEPGSPAYETAFNAGLSQLKTDQAQIRTMLRSGAGKQVTSVNAGEQVTWATPMSLQQQLGCYTRAIAELMGLTYLQTRTTARFLY